MREGKYRFTLSRIASRALVSKFEFPNQDLQNHPSPPTKKNPCVGVQRNSRNLSRAPSPYSRFVNVTASSPALTPYAYLLYARPEPSNMHAANVAVTIARNTKDAPNRRDDVVAVDGASCVMDASYGCRRGVCSSASMAAIAVDARRRRRDSTTSRTVARFSCFGCSKRASRVSGPA